MMFFRFCRIVRDLVRVAILFFAVIFSRHDFMLAHCGRIGLVSYQVEQVNILAPASVAGPVGAHDVTAGSFDPADIFGLFSLLSGDEGFSIEPYKLAMQKQLIAWCISLRM